MAREQRSEKTPQSNPPVHVRPARGVRLIERGGSVLAFPEPHRTPVLPAGWAPLSREQQDIDLFNGRLSREKCDQLLDHWIDASSIDTAFICGPQDMMLGVAQSLEGHGLDKRQIKFELFATSTPSRRQRESRAPC